MNSSVFKIGFWSGIIAFTASLSFVIVQLMQLAGSLTYPMDEILIYGFSLCITLPFLLSMLALHYITPPEKKIWSHAALLFTAIYVVFVTANYVVQLATVIPANLRGEGEEIKLLFQTPHSLFWDFDAIGYIMMGFAMFIAIPVFNKEKIQLWVKYAFLANALVTPLISYVYFYPVFSEQLLLLGLPWAVTAPAAMLALALLFRKKMNSKKVSDRSTGKNLALKEQNHHYI